MFNGVTFTDFEKNDYSIPDVLGNSSRAETPHDLDDIDRLSHFLIQRKEIKRDNFNWWLRPYIEFDFSSVFPQIKVNNETHDSEFISEEDIFRAIVNDDYLVNMPKKKQKVKLKIKKISNYKPRIREPEVL